MTAHGRLKDRQPQDAKAPFSRFNYELSQLKYRLIGCQHGQNTREFTHNEASMDVLNSVSSECARGKSSIARKPEDHPENFKW